jgi:hypothetical protein
MQKGSTLFFNPQTACKQLQNNKKKTEENSYNRFGSSKFFEISDSLYLTL